LDIEYQFWLKSRTVAITKLVDQQPITYYLNRYLANNTLPRPESYLNDIAVGQRFGRQTQRSVYQQIATTAETGWDFSTRWMRNYSDLATLQTSNIIPVDLNCILYLNELTLSRFHTFLGDLQQAQFYEGQYTQRLNAIQEILWDPVDLSWHDYNYVNKSLNPNFYPSNLLPFWAGAYDREQFNSTVLLVMLANLKDVFNFPAGIPTSLTNSLQQWDYPNGWAPLQYFVITGLFQLAEEQTQLRDNSDLDKETASKLVQTTNTFLQNLVRNWVTTNYCAWKKTGVMWEKYNITSIGSAGGGGEYPVQDGFGWTNGVILYLLQNFSKTLQLGQC